MMRTITICLTALAASLALGCMPNPPEAEPPEVEVSGGELPEYDGRTSDLDDQDDDDALALDLDLNDDDDFDDVEPFITGD